MASNEEQSDVEKAASLIVGGLFGAAFFLGLFAIGVAVIVKAC